MSEASVLDFPASRLAPTESISASEAEEYLLRFNSFFGFNDSPFNNTPDPNLFFMSRRHCEALTSMIFGVQQRRGFIVVTGEIGAGKTTLCRQFLHDLSPDVKSAVILNPKVSGTYLLASVTQDFGIQPRGRTKRDYFEAINKFLIEGLAHNQNACLIIDEAQCIAVNLLEEVRLLSNLETSKQKLLQIILVGQPELKAMLMKPNLMQLRQRIGVYTHLEALDVEETRDYIQHRLKCVDTGKSRVRFTSEVVMRIHEVSRGIPRLINTVCDRILMAAYAHQTCEITNAIAGCAFEELSFICS